MYFVAQKVTKHGARSSWLVYDIAQLVERLFAIQKVEGSIPSIVTIKRLKTQSRALR